MQLLLYIIITALPAFGLYCFIVDFLIPKHEYRNTEKQKAAQDREAQRQADQLLGEYPTYSRHCTNVNFSETELGYSLPATTDL